MTTPTKNDSNLDGTENNCNYVPTRPRGPIAAMYCSPGPVYGLPNLTGYPNHDSRSVFTRGPAYSLAAKLGVSDYYKSPGPAAYKPGEKYTNLGPDGAPRYTMGGTGMDLSCKFQAPGPGTYRPEDTTSIFPHQPESSFGVKLSELGRCDIPAPNAYKLPRTDIVSDKRQGPQYSMTRRGDSIFGSKDGPGPAGYKYTDPDLVLNAAPKYSMGTTAVPPRGTSKNPGPGTYKHEDVKVHLFNYGGSGFSFGIKHSEYKGERTDRTSSAVEEDD